MQQINLDAIALKWKNSTKWMSLALTLFLDVSQISTSHDNTIRHILCLRGEQKSDPKESTNTCWALRIAPLWYQSDFQFETNSHALASRIMLGSKR
jgi:hypothetical protein